MTQKIHIIVKIMDLSMHQRLRVICIICFVSEKQFNHVLPNFKRRNSLILNILYMTLNT